MSIFRQNYSNGVGKTAFYLSIGPILGKKKLVKTCFLFHFLTVNVYFLALCWKFSNGFVGTSFHVSNGTFQSNINFSNGKYTFIVFGHWLEVFCNSHDEKSVVLSKLLYTSLKVVEKNVSEKTYFLLDFRKLSGKSLAYCRRILKSCQNCFLLVHRYSFRETIVGHWP